jgi:hypothetical protein
MGEEAPKEAPKKLSLTQKYLPVDCWRLMSKKTSFGTTIYDCCKSALENPDSGVGLYAPGKPSTKLKLIFLNFFFF